MSIFKQALVTHLPTLSEDEARQLTELLLSLRNSRKEGAKFVIVGLVGRGATTYATEEDALNAAKRFTASEGYEYYVCKATKHVAKGEPIVKDLV